MPSPLKSDPVISIHALHEEGDHTRKETIIQKIEFLSTPSTRRATYKKPIKYFLAAISIHALHEEGDSF